ncbi:predicted protein [Nematostella vectensis]|uniref:Neurogenic mastermind-like N-terminal domain-containing protein n=1 Tax=Nematostella vectensis TaxID=45351 RepID=A7SLJ1_NEMVE|nr:predicted protein [Nematostella vectensis]|eukprot:XP_001627503.1 predicted protein [Nematostella vectensis]
MGDTGMTPKHRVVVDKLRVRLTGYREHHNTCQSKQDRLQALREDQVRQDAAMLHQRAIDRSAVKMQPKMKLHDAGAKNEHQSNGPEVGKSTTAKLQQQILKRKYDQGLSNTVNILNNDKENGQGSESLSKYQRTDEFSNTGLQSHELQGMNLGSQHDQHSTAASSQQLDSIETLSNPNLSTGGHFVNDGSRSSPLLTNNTEAYNVRLQSQSPNTLQQAPSEFKQEPRQIVVSCDGGRLSVPGAPHEAMANGVSISNTSVRTSENNNTNDGFAGQGLQQELKDFEDVLRKYQSQSYKGSPINNNEISPQQHRQLQRPSQPGQMDNVTRETRSAQQSPSSLTNPVSTQKHQFTGGQQGATGPTALHLQQLARQAQSQRARGFIENPDQDSTNMSQYSAQNMQYYDMRFASSGSQAQVPNTGTMPQVTPAGRLRPPMPPSTSDQYGNMYSSKDQNQSIMSTGFPSNASLQYQRMMHSQASQQALYNRMNAQQNMSQRLSHPSIPEQQAYNPYGNQQVMSQAPPQVNNMSMQNMPAYSSSGYPNMRGNQFQRQLSMPVMSQGYPNQEQYAQQMQQYQVNEQQGPMPQQQQPQGDMNCGSYQYNRRNSFPLYHRAMSQPAGAYGQANHEGYNGPMSQMRGMPGQAPSMIEGQGGPAQGYAYNSRTPNMTAPQSNQILHLQGQQRVNATMATPGVQIQQQHPDHGMAYGGSAMRDLNSQSVTQDMKYSNRSDIQKTVGGYNGTMGMPEAGSVPVSRNNNNDTQFNAFSPLAALEKAPSLTSLLDQSSGNLTNLETTYTGSIPNLELLGDIIGQGV